MSKEFFCSYNCGVPATHSPDRIIVHGAREHNLKNICFQIPKGKLVALTGPSGSGKSSIATDILQGECVRQLLESLGMTTDHIEKAKVDLIKGLSPSIGVSQRVANFNPRSTVGTKSGILTILRNMFAALADQLCGGCGETVRQPLQDKHKLVVVEVEEEQASSSSKKRKKSYFDCPHCGYQLEKLTMSHFSANTIEGACSTCKGIGETIGIDFSQLLREEKTIREGGVALWDESLVKYYQNVIVAASKHYNFEFDIELPIRDYTKEQRNFLLYGINSPDFIKTYKDIKAPKKVSDGLFEGIVPPFLALYKKDSTKASYDIKRYIVQEACIDCSNTGLASLGRRATVSGKTIVDVSTLSLSELLDWIQSLGLNIAQNDLQVLVAVSAALEERLSNIIEVGLYYLTLDRTLPSLSAGECQRLRLASLLGSGLTGVLYVLDEPTTGLHPHDTEKLLKTLKKIEEAGNTILVIEHDIDVIKHADYIIDMGPRGGSQGGQVVISGSPEEVIACAESVTGKYLSKKPTIKSHLYSGNSGAVLSVRGASLHNLKNIDVDIPTNQLVVITGVSGSGKSTFLFDIVDKVARKYFNNTSDIPGKHTSVDGLQHFNRVITLDQIAIGNSKSSRSNVATYTKLFDLIRDLFATLPKAKSRGFNAATFSFNSSDERCQNCNGAGTVEVDMTFMPDIEKECPVCLGMRFTEELLTVQFQGYNIAHILDMTVSDAIGLFRNEKKIFAILDVMVQVGLEYLKLGQSTSTLSGGEAQRIKLAAELSKSATAKTLFLLDEPTTGLHPQEVEFLLGVLKKLVCKGNTVVAVEHNLDVICQADTIIDFGPQGGIAGGNVVALGTPQEVAENENSLTGQCLKAHIAQT